MTFYAILAQETGAPDPGGAGPTATGGGGGGGFDSSFLIMMLLLFAVFYFVLIRPQQKKQKDQQRHREEMIKNLKKNDHVVTIGGLHGIVSSVTDTDVVIKADEKNDVRLRFAREAISRVVTEDEEKTSIDPKLLDDSKDKN